MCPQSLHLFFPRAAGCHGDLAAGRAAGGSSPREPSTITCCCCCSKKKLYTFDFLKEASTNNPTNGPGDSGTAVDMVTVVTRAAQTIFSHCRGESGAGQFSGGGFSFGFLGQIHRRHVNTHRCFRLTRGTEGRPAPAQRHQLVLPRRAAACRSVSRFQHFGTSPDPKLFRHDQLFTRGICSGLCQKR